jgi:hypothetical protein
MSSNDKINRDSMNNDISICYKSKSGLVFNTEKEAILDNNRKNLFSLLESELSSIIKNTFDLSDESDFCYSVSEIDILDFIINNGAIINKYLSKFEEKDN